VAVAGDVSSYPEVVYCWIVLPEGGIAIYIGGHDTLLSDLWCDECCSYLALRLVHDP